MHSVQTVPFQSNPAFDGTAASTRSEANPDLGYHVKVEVVEHSSKHVLRHKTLKLSWSLRFLE